MAAQQQSYHHLLQKVLTYQLAHRAHESHQLETGITFRLCVPGDVASSSMAASSGLSTRTSAAAYTATAYSTAAYTATAYSTAGM